MAKGLLCSEQSEWHDSVLKRTRSRLRSSLSRAEKHHRGVVLYEFNPPTHRSEHNACHNDTHYALVMATPQRCPNK